MTKKPTEEDINGGFKVGDVVKSHNGKLEGVIQGFEWSGVRRAHVKVGEGPGWYVVAISDLALVKSIRIEPVEITKTLEENK